MGILISRILWIIIRIQEIQITVYAAGILWRRCAFTLQTFREECIVIRLFGYSLQVNLPTVAKVIEVVDRCTRIHQRIKTDIFSEQSAIL